MASRSRLEFMFSIKSRDEVSSLPRHPSSSLDRRKQEALFQDSYSSESVVEQWRRTHATSQEDLSSAQPDSVQFSLERMCGLWQVTVSELRSSTSNTVTIIEGSFLGCWYDWGNALLHSLHFSEPWDAQDGSWTGFLWRRQYWRLVASFFYFINV